MRESEIRLGLTFDDVLLVPKRSAVETRAQVSTRTQFTRQIAMAIPIVSANMDAVTESEMAIAIAREGGIGVIHRFLPIERQVAEVRRVKRAESVVIEEPYTIEPTRPIRDALAFMDEHGSAGLLVVQDGRKYGLPIADVKEMVKFRPDDLASMQGKRIAVIRGELMPVLFLGEFFGEGKKENGNEELCLVILTSGFALVVDDFLGQEDVVLKSLPAGFGSGSCFAGAAILGDGSILLVLDPHRMWGQFQQTDH